MDEESLAEAIAILQAREESIRKARQQLHTELMRMVAKRMIAEAKLVSGQGSPVPQEA
jgi:prefoldin subunit 5